VWQDFPREGYDEGVGTRMNTVVFAIIIGVATLLVIFLIQKVLDNPNS
jgi:hypothetical protein